MKHYSPTGTCYNCDSFIPDERFTVSTPIPDYRFCSAKCQQAYRTRFPRRYAQIIQQLQEIVEHNAEAK